MDTQIKRGIFHPKQGSLNNLKTILSNELLQAHLDFPFLYAFDESLFVMPSYRNHLVLNDDISVVEL